MNAQATRLATVADNVANVNTTGYKAASCEFSSLLLSDSEIGYECGSVLTNIRHHVSAQGGLTSTSSFTDLAISGNGFFLVADPDGTPFLTRAGSFIPDGEGELVNAAGFTLLGYTVDPEEMGVIVNGFGNLTPINISNMALTATPSTQGVLRVNLPSAAVEVPAGDLPSLNLAGSQFTAKSSLVVYDNLGAEVRLDIFYSKTADSTWEMAIFDGRTADSGGSFPYSAAALATETLNFGTDGRFAAGQAEQVTFQVPGGEEIVIDLSGSTQLATGYSVLSASSNGSPAGRPDRLEFARDGYVYAQYRSGTRVPVYRVPLANVTSPDRLTPLPGNVYSASNDSGAISISFSGSDGLGNVISSALEQSTVDLAGELTTMIDSQRSYTANSKVFQTGAELMEVLVNLKR